MYPLTGAICIKIKERLAEISKMRSYWKFSKATIFPAYEREYWRLSDYERIIRKTNKTVCSTEGKYLTTNQALAIIDGKFFTKRVINL